MFSVFSAFCMSSSGFLARLATTSLVRVETYLPSLALKASHTADLCVIIVAIFAVVSSSKRKLESPDLFNYNFLHKPYLSVLLSQNLQTAHRSLLFNSVFFSLEALDFIVASLNFCAKVKKYAYCAKKVKIIFPFWGLSADFLILNPV